MAVQDVKEYYYKIQAQKLELEADLADFEKALKDGFITEERMKEAEAELIPFQINYDRLTYVMYLLEKPKSKRKKPKYDRANKKLLDEFSARNADESSVILENKSALDAFRKELKQLKETKEN